MIRLTETEIQTLRSMREQARAGVIGYWQIYQHITDLLTTTYSTSASDSSVLWLRGATEANAGRGAFSVLIREYTETQYELRYGTTLTQSQMQAASNAVAENLLRDVIGESEAVDGWPRGQVPDIARIAIADARAVGETLFSTDITDTASASRSNSAWSGTLLFNLLNRDQSSRLLSTGATGSADTLNDWRDILYAFKSYEAGFAAATSAATQQPITDAAIFGATAWGFITQGGSASALLDAIRLGTSNPALKQAFSLIGGAGANAFLDMLLGASTGQCLIGTTTDANFAQRCEAYFGALTPAQLQSIRATAMPTSAAAIASLAMTDADARVALAALSLVKLDASAAVEARFGLYNEQSNPSGLTQSWIADRAGMLQALANTRPGQTAVGSTNTDYVDVASGLTVWQRRLGLGVSAPANRVVFGGPDSAANDERFACAA